MYPHSTSTIIGYLSLSTPRSITKIENKLYGHLKLIYQALPKNKPKIPDALSKSTKMEHWSNTLESICNSIWLTLRYEVDSSRNSRLVAVIF